MASAKKQSTVRVTSTSRSNRKRASKFVVCVSDRDDPTSLELHKIYRVLPDKQAERDGDLRLIDESGPIRSQIATIAMVATRPPPYRPAAH